MTEYANRVELILENQAGFRKKYSTVDHIFSLYSLIELSKTFKTKLFCAFIDFEKAFDSVWRVGLCNKILLNNIDGKFFNIITNMYKGIKSCVTTKGLTSDMFPCTVGVRQGENLSPFLFTLYLNDLEGFLSTNGVKGLTSLSYQLENKCNLYLRLFVLLYADDTILLSESPDDLQHQLNVFQRYCKSWHLKVNSDKTKIVIFNKDRCHVDYSFKYGDISLEVVDNFKYLGVHFCKNGSFNLNVKELCEKATKAMYSVIGKCRKHNMSIDCKLDIFDKIVKPILLYGCEVWGFGNIALVEKLHLKFCKNILNLKSSTPNYIWFMGNSDDIH